MPPRLYIDVERTSRSAQSSLLAIAAVVLDDHGQLSRPFSVSVRRQKTEWDAWARDWWRQFPDVYHALIFQADVVDEAEAMKRLHGYLSGLPAGEPWLIDAGIIDIDTINIAMIAWARKAGLMVGHDVSHFTLPFMLPGNAGNGFCHVECSRTQRRVTEDLLEALGRPDLLQHWRHATIAFAQHHWAALRPAGLPEMLAAGAQHHPLWDVLYAAGQEVAYQQIVGQLSAQRLHLSEKSQPAKRL